MNKRSQKEKLILSCRVCSTDDWISLQQQTSGRARNNQKENDSQNAKRRKDSSTNKLDVVGQRDAGEKIDWLGLLNKLEHETNRKKITEDDSKPLSDFMLRLNGIRDQIMKIANSTAIVLNTTLRSERSSSLYLHRAKTPFDQPIDFLTRILPPPTRIFNVGVDKRKSNVVVLVLSHQGSFVKRQAIRETWARNHSSNVLFVVAQSDCSEFEHDLMSSSVGNGGDDIGKLQQAPDVIYIDDDIQKTNKQQVMDHRRLDTIHDDINLTHTNYSTRSCDDIDHNFLRLEQQRYQDLLEIPMKEHYDRLPEKLLQAYHWVVHNLPHVEWIVKSDDDMYVRYHSLESYLKKYNCNSPMVIGEIIDKSPVSRHGKWAEFDYPYDYYPMWPKGSAGHVVSKEVAQYLSKMSESLHRYQGEDTSIGIWLDEAQTNGS